MDLDLVLSIGNLTIGIFMALVGFKIFNPFNWEDPGKELEWHRKWGTFIKIGGISVALVGLFRIML